MCQCEYQCIHVFNFFPSDNGNSFCEDYQEKNKNLHWLYINIFFLLCKTTDVVCPHTQWSGKACFKVFSNCYFIDFFKIEIVNVPKDWFLIEFWLASLANFVSLMIKIMHVCICKTFSNSIIFDYLQVRGSGVKTQYNINCDRCQGCQGRYWRKFVPFSFQGVS